MKIKRRHIKMARAWCKAWQNSASWHYYSDQQWALVQSCERWHRAAKGKHQ